MIFLLVELLAQIDWSAVGAMATAFGVFWAVIEYHFNHRRLVRRERYTRTVDACERFVLDATLSRDGAALSAATNRLTVRGEFPDDGAIAELDSLRTSVSRLLAYLEILCKGIEKDIYDADIVREYLGEEIARFHIAFLQDYATISHKWEGTHPAISDFVRREIVKDKTIADMIINNRSRPHTNV